MPKDFEIFTNPILFNKLKRLGLHITDLSYIVQNDITMSHDDVWKWLLDATEAYNELDTICKDIIAYVKLPPEEQQVISAKAKRTELQNNIEVRKVHSSIDNYFINKLTDDDGPF